MKSNILASICIGVLGLAGCHKVDPGQVASANTAPDAVTAAVPADTPPSGVAPTPAVVAAPAQPIALASGTRMRVRLSDALDTKRNRAGDRFTATLDEPLVNGDRVVVPKGTTFTGHVTESKPSGRFKGNAVMALRLDSFSMNGRTYQIRSNGSARVSAGHKKHNLVWIGGGSGGGAAIGAIAGGGTGALIGAGAGAGAGVIGSAITGKREIYLPAETPLTFTLSAPVDLG